MRSRWMITEFGLLLICDITTANVISSEYKKAIMCTIQTEPFEILLKEHT